MPQKEIGNLSKGLCFVISAPAGTGKTTLVRMLSKEFPCIWESVSCTTRPPREGEEEGKDYFFLSQEVFNLKKEQGDFLESANVFGYDYGTSKDSVHTQQEKGYHVFLVIDTQGAVQLKKDQFPAIYIFLSPPSLDELRVRLEKRQQDSLEAIKKRLAWAEAEIAAAEGYDYHIVNDHLNLAYVVLRSIVVAEEHRVRIK